MTDLERDLRETLKKYDREIHTISIILTNHERNILEIVFEEMNDSFKRGRFKAGSSR